MSQESEEPVAILVIRELMQAANWHYERHEKRDQGSQQDKPRPGANHEEMTTVKHDIGDSIWQPPDYRWTPVTFP